MIGTALVDKLAQEDDQVIWDPALVKWTPHEKTLHECPELTLQARKKGPACGLCSAYSASCDWIVRAPGGVGCYPLQNATVLTPMYASGAEPQLHRCKKTKKKELELIVHSLRRIKTCKTIHKRVTSNMLIEFEGFTMTKNASSYNVSLLVIFYSKYRWLLVTIIISVEA